MAMLRRMVETGKITLLDFRGQRKEVAILKASETLITYVDLHRWGMLHASPCIMWTLRKDRKDSHARTPRR